MQRLSAARMFFHEPAFCLADECTSALDLRMESFIYQECAKRKISMISVAHRPSVIAHHDSVFRFKKEDRLWELVPSKEVSSMEKFSADLGEEEKKDDAPPEVAEAGDGPGGFGPLFIRRMYRALRLGVGWPGLFYMFVQLCCMGIYGMLICIIFKNYGTSVIISKVTGTGGYQRDVTGALNYAGTIIALNMVASVVQSVSAFLGALLGIRIQRGITFKFHEGYFTPGVVYHTNRMLNQSGVDQRMVQLLQRRRPRRQKQQEGAQEEAFEEAGAAAPA